MKPYDERSGSRQSVKGVHNEVGDDLENFAHLKAIFEPFFTAKGEQGTAHGLALSRKITSKLLRLHLLIGARLREIFAGSRCVSCDGAVWTVEASSVAFCSQTLVSDQRRATIWIWLSCVENASGFAVRAAIEDDGPGIAPEHIDLLFEPFFMTKADVGKGLGPWARRRSSNATGEQSRSIREPKVVSAVRLSSLRFGVKWVTGLRDGRVRKIRATLCPARDRSVRPEGRKIDNS